MAWLDERLRALEIIEALDQYRRAVIEHSSTIDDYRGFMDDEMAASAVENQRPAEAEARADLLKLLGIRE